MQHELKYKKKVFIYFCEGSSGQSLLVNLFWSIWTAPNRLL